MGSDAKAKLVSFLDQKAFQPVLKARAESYPETKRDKLQHVQRATASERDRFYEYESAQKVYQMFRDDLTSEPAQKIDRELRELHLPTLADVRDDFERLAKRLRVQG